MSLLAKLFGDNKSRDRLPTPAEAIQRLAEIEDMLGKKQEYLEKRIQDELSTAKKNGTKNKRVALQALRRKKTFEKQLNQIDGTLTTIEFQRGALENASANTEIMKVMGYAAKVLKRTQDDMSIDDIHEIMEDIQEQQEIANEIADTMSNPFASYYDIDEDELMNELEALEQDELNEKLVEIDPKLNDLPTPPEVEPGRKNQRTEEEEDMRMLEEWNFS